MIHDFYYQLGIDRGQNSAWAEILLAGTGAGSGLGYILSIYRFTIVVTLVTLYTLTGQKYLYTAKYPCTDCAIYRLKNQLGTKMGIEICRDQKSSLC